MLILRLVGSLITFAFWCTVALAIVILFAVDKNGNVTLTPDKPRENRFHQGGGLIIPQVDTRRY